MTDICPLARKRTYLSLAAAQQACFDGMVPYRCPHFPHLHVGHPWKSWRASPAVSQ